MKTINEIQDHELVFDERNDSQIYAFDLKPDELFGDEIKRLFLEV